MGPRRTKRRSLRIARRIKERMLRCTMTASPVFALFCCASHAFSLGVHTALALSVSMHLYQSLFYIIIHHGASYIHCQASTLLRMLCLANATISYFLSPLSHTHPFPFHLRKCSRVRVSCWARGVANWDWWYCAVGLLSDIAWNDGPCLALRHAAVVLQASVSGSLLPNLRHSCRARLGSAHVYVRRSLLLILRHLYLAVTNVSLSRFQSAVAVSAHIVPLFLSF